MNFLPHPRQSVWTVILITTLSVLFWACQPAPGLDPPVPRLTQTITAYYFKDRPPRAPGGVTQSLTYQTIPFYASYRTQTRFTYDPQQRITQVKTTDADYPNDSLSALGNVTFQYTGNTITLTNLKVSPVLPLTYSLTPAGYISEHRRYDSEGYLVAQQETLFLTRQTILAGNIRERVTEDAIGRMTTSYEYDLLKRSLPDPYVAQHGRSSRNLVVKATSVGESFTGVAPVMANRTTQVYEYALNADGTIRQQTVYIGENFAADQPIGWYRIEVTTFGYN